MIARRTLLIAGAGAIALPVYALGQPQRKPAHIAILSSESSSEAIHQVRVDAMKQGLREKGYEEGKNLSFEFSYANGRYDALPGLATTVAERGPSLIVAIGIKAAIAAKKATATIPIVLPATTADVVSLGLAASLAKPGGNFTGATSFGPEILAKRLELLKEVMPRTIRTGFLFNPSNPGIGPTLRIIEATAKSRNLTLLLVKARDPDEFDAAFSELVQHRIQALVLQGDTLFTINSRKLADLAWKHRIAAAGTLDFARAGGLLGYSANVEEQFRRAASHIAKILAGAKPGDLPIEQPTKFELELNMKTARALGIKIPDSIRLRADKVIE